LYRDVTPDPAKAQQFRDKALIATQKAIQKAPRLDGKVILATNLERLGDEKDALSIYKAFLAEAERSPNSTNGDFEATPMMQKEIRHQREVLIMDIQLRVKELEGQLRRRSHLYSSYPISRRSPLNVILSEANSKRPLVVQRRISASLRAR
jgi:hypothetical protein